MTDKSKILIIGCGTLGFGLTHVLLRAGCKVDIWDEEALDIFEHTSTKTCCNRYGWMRKYPIMRDKLTIQDGEMINSAGYDFIIVATSLKGLDPVLKKLKDLDSKTAIVTVQKGLTTSLHTPEETPYGLVRSKFPNNPVFSFTGAGFGKHMAQGQIIRMVAAAETSNPSGIGEALCFGRVFEGTNIKVDISYDPKTMCFGGMLRTVYSLITAIVRHYLKDQDGTLASALGGIDSEYWLALAAMTNDIDPLPLTSTVRTVLACDRFLCDFNPNSLSRNMILGLELATVEDPDVAYRTVQEIYGTVEGWDNIPIAYHRVIGPPADNFNPDTVENRLMEFPYLYAIYWWLAERRWTLDRCVEYMYSRQNQP